MTDTIMIVDDNSIEREFFTEAFRQKGMNIISTGDPTKAIILAIEKKPTFIILDLYMPDVDGFEVCRILKTDDRTKDIPVLFVTSSSNPDDIKSGFHLGCVDYINKPASINDLIDVIAKHKVINELKEAVRPLREISERLTQRYLKGDDQIV